MAHSYYPPRRVRSHSVSDVPQRVSADEELAGDLEQSIFIFPCPGSRTSGRTDIDIEPPSPLSIPTDASFPTTSPSATNTDDISRGRRISDASGFSQWTFSNSGRSVSVDTSLRSPLVEVWEMSDDAMENEDANGGGTPVPPSPLRQQQQQHQQQRIPLGRRPFPSHFVFSDGRLQLHARKKSFISSADSCNGAASSLDQETPAPKYADVSHLPFLAFFSSLLSIEDATVHLLTRSTPPYTSPLFPGGPLQSSESYSPDTIFDEKRALFASSPTASLKSGMEAASDPSITSKSVFSLPKPPPVPALPFTYFMDFVKELYSATMPKKVRLVARAA
ncbi:hypothetical protein ACEPAI_9003 [Sanghuangporus weigelae]